MARPLRVLSIGHSYVVALNRRLAQEMSRIGGSRWDVAVASPAFMPGDLRPIPLEYSEEEGLRLEAVNVHFAHRIHVMLYGRKLKALLRENWDIVHCWEEPFILAGAQVARWLRPGSSLVYSTCQNINKRYPPPFCWTERYAMSKASGWIAFGETIRQALVQRPAYANLPMRILPFGVDVDVFRPESERGDAVRRSLGWDAPGPPVIGYFGRFIEEKGLSLLMRVLDRIASPWRAMFVGGGPMESALRSWAQQRPDRVRIVGNVTHDRVPEHLNAMDIVCAPSQTTPRWREQFGRMLVEAFASALPVIASGSGEIPYVVGDAGIIVGEKDEQGWGQAIEKLLAEPHTRRTLGDAALARAHEKFAWSVVAKGHLEFFESLR